MRTTDRSKTRENAVDEIPVIEKNVNIKKSGNIPNMMNTNIYKNCYMQNNVKESNISSSRVKNVNHNSKILNLNNYSKSKIKNGGNFYIN